MTCPMCAGEVREHSLAQILNGVRVCAKCRVGFTNRRHFAAVIDAIVVSLVSHVMAIALQMSGLLIAGGGAQSTSLGLFLVNWVAPLLLFTLKDGFGGYSAGKFLLGVQVIDVNSREPIGFAQSLKRNLVLLVPCVGVLVVYFTMVKGRRWGDGWANSMVVWKRFEHKTPFDPRGVVCVRCGYDLTGNTAGRCPECGLSIAGLHPRSQF